MHNRILLCILACVVAGVFGCGPIEDNNGAGLTITENITDDMTLSGTNVIQNRIAIKAQLTIEECSTIQVASGVIIDVDDGGSIVVNGTEDCPVTFTSAKAGASAGDWNRFDIWDTSSNNNSFSHTVFEYGGGGDTQWGMMWVQSGASVSLSNVTFRDSSGRAAHFETGANIEGFSNVTVENLGRESFIIGPNEVGSLESLTANGDVPAIEIRGGALTEDQTWRKLGVPYIIAARTGIEGALQIEPGTVVQIGPEVIVDVDNGGTIQANGTSEAPVVFTSSKASPASGDWARFDIWASSGNANEFTHSVIEYGGEDPTYGAMWVEQGANVALDNVSFANNDGCDIDDNGTVNTTSTDYVACQ